MTADPLRCFPLSGGGYDSNCDHMAAVEAVIEPAAGDRTAYFDAPVPRRLHQIWYGETHPVFSVRMDQWQKYAERFGYGYKLWTAADDDALQHIFPAKNKQIFDYFRGVGAHKCASDLLRLTLLATFGGIYLDSDLQPPRDDKGAIDFSQWMPMRNLTAIAENGAREIGASGIFLTNCFLMSAPAHPMILHLEKSLPNNHARWLQNREPYAEYTCGPFFFTKSLGGAVQVIKMHQAQDFFLFGDGPELDPTTLQAAGVRSILQESF